MLSKAQKNAIARYQAKAGRRVTLAFYPPDWDVYAYISAHGNKAGYIKQVMRERMEQEITAGTYAPDSTGKEQ